MTSESDLQLHQILLSGDPTGPRDFVEAMGERLFRILRGKYRYLAEEDVRDGAHDALLAVIEYPDKFDPARGSLMNFLVQIGCREIIDQMRRAGRRPHIVAETDVEDEALPANEMDGGEVNLPFSLEDLSPETQSLIQSTLPDERDQRLLALICDGRRNTEEFATVLEISHLSEAEQRRIAKRHRDRILKKLQRHSPNPRNSP